MSRASKKSSVCHSNYSESKLGYVKESNLGQILGLNLKIDQSRHEIVTHYDAENFLRPDRELFVNEWIRKHKDNFLHKDYLVYSTSPVLGTSSGKRRPSSPIVGDCRKRPRNRLFLEDNHRGKNKPSPVDVDRPKNKTNILSSSYLSNHTEQSASKVEKTREQNSRQSLVCHESPSCNGINKSPTHNLNTRLQESSLASCVQKSPTLNAKLRFRKLRQKRVSAKKSFKSSIRFAETFESENCQNLKNNLNSEECYFVPRIPMIVNTSNEKSSDAQFEEKKIDGETYEAVEIEDVSSNESERIEFCDKTQFTTHKSKEKISLTYITEIENDSSTKGSILIVTKSSQLPGDNEKTFIQDETDEEETASNLIEDVDTPDIFFINNFEKESLKAKEKVLLSCRSLAEVSDETFFSGAESFPCRHRQPTQKISKISSLKNKTESLCQGNNVISTESVLPKPLAEPFFNILKSEKKKRKMKKGGLLAKVQTLVSREISYLRMWQHQISQPTFQNVNVQFVDLCIQQSYISYSKQFIECLLIADTYNLLKGVMEWQTNESADFQNTGSNRSIDRPITIMMNPEVVGPLNAKRGERLKIYPPWEISDKENNILSVMYFTLDKKVNFKLSNKEELTGVMENKVIENFDCPCIERGRISENCCFKFNGKKSNMIQKIFNIT